MAVEQGVATITGTTVNGKCIIDGIASGEVIGSDTMLSFCLGVDPLNGRIIDKHHPLCGVNMKEKILALPCSRGSCGGSAVLLELLMEGHAPAGLIFERDEYMLPLGVMVGDEVFGLSIPVVQLASEDFRAVCKASYARVWGDTVVYASSPLKSAATKALAQSNPQKREKYALSLSDFRLTPFDCELLDGKYGKAAQASMRIILRLAQLQGAVEMIDVTRAHLDGTTYLGPGTVRFARKMNEWGAKVRIPSTLNSTFVDRQRWQVQGIHEDVASPANELAEAYVRMGARPTYTCAPYALPEHTPQKDEIIIWGESNAGMYANSVLGARTLKVADHLELCIALTGRAPLTGNYLTVNRVAQLHVELPALHKVDDSFWPLLGYITGDHAIDRIPILCGLYHLKPSSDALKAFGAAFATTSNAPMFHMAGVTPEAQTAAQVAGHIAGAKATWQVETSDLVAGWQRMDAGPDDEVDMVSFGNPHYTFTEFETLAALCQGRTKSPKVEIIITCGRDVYGKAYKAGYVPILETFGAKVLIDICWCTITEPLIPASA